MFSIVKNYKIFFSITIIFLLIGFAVTLAIGVILSMFSAITVTKFLLRFLISSNFTKNPAFFGVSAPKEVNK